jgi:predicted porin
MNSSSTFALALALGACAAGAQAQSASAYGLPGSGTVDERACRGCHRSAQANFPVRRNELRGSGPLSKKISAIYNVEAGALLDSGTGTAEDRIRLGRQAYVGVAGKFGAVTVGRHYNLEQLAVNEVADPFQGGMAGSAGNLIGHSEAELDSSVQYMSRAKDGLSAGASLGLGDVSGKGRGLGEVSGNPRGNRAWGISVGLARGAFTLRVAHQNKNTARVRTATALGNTMDAKNTILAANYDVGIGKVYAAYSANRGWGSSPLWNPDNPYSASMGTTASTDSRDVLVGLAVPYGATTFLASYIRKNDRNLADQDANQAAIGFAYASSRKTDFYAAYSRITNRNGGGYKVGAAQGAPSGNSALNVGMRHSF